MSFEAGRNELKSSCGPEIRAAIEYLREMKHPIKTINYKQTSWWLKHEVGKWYEEKYGHHMYISQGSLVTAVLMLGYKFKPSEVVPGAYFAVGNIR